VSRMQVYTRGQDRRPLYRLQGRLCVENASLHTSSAILAGDTGVCIACKVVPLSIHHLSLHSSPPSPASSAVSLAPSILYAIG
jgi:hypothetical protein